MSGLQLLKNTFLLLVFVSVSCGKKLKVGTPNIKTPSTALRVTLEKKDIIVGANQTTKYFSLLENKRVAVVANQTSVIFSSDTTWTHLVDSLIAAKVNVKKVFAPEHGFRGKADAGEHVEDGLDKKTGLPLLSLHGKNKKPTQEQLDDLDMMIFDIQDVGARFYTYISTLHYVMEACAEKGIPLLILDRPNPNGHYVDGPVMEEAFKSFLGMHAIPIVHGMTIAEYAQMINGEQWLQDGLQSELHIVPVRNYTHQVAYSLPIKPSPNLPNDVAINLYPSICFFEQTPVSLGRGTDMQFQVLGTPDYRIEKHAFSFTPRPNEGSRYPKHEGKECWGEDLRTTEWLSEIRLDWLIDWYKTNEQNNKGVPFFQKYFSRLAGTKKLEEQIKAGWTAKQIKESWQPDLERYKKIRAKYLIYE
ncbi:exo-beta-N-acetylmuramidase NamZ domain-containing protein [Sungkyunkwania multivorans]|uniref:Exo-beta-N-acetylmuramidase NamZ domain-containing protein n=1 Tax=Sungkyunkwania multivorans TaxID=1173618 RepID=A0ABW3CU70_9FLAO